MQCPKCNYISFKIEKKCGACGHKFKNNLNSPPLLAKGLFSICALPTLNEEYKILKEKENSVESVGILEAPELETFIDSKTGDFKLDLPGIEESKIEDAQASSEPDKEVLEYGPLNFDANADIDPREIETIGLGLGPFQTTEEEKIKQTQSLGTEPIIIEGPKTSSLEPAYETTKTKEEPPISIQPALEIPEPLEESDFAKEPVLEIPETDGEQLNPELDLGENQAKLDMSYEPPSPNEPETVVHAPNFNLEINDSEGPLITQKNEVPDVEIEDPGLELESSDESEKDKS